MWWWLVHWALAIHFSSLTLFNTKWRMWSYQYEKWFLVGTHFILWKESSLSSLYIPGWPSSDLIICIGVVFMMFNTSSHYHNIKLDKSAAVPLYCEGMCGAGLWWPGIRPAKYFLPPRCQAAELGWVSQPVTAPGHQPPVSTGSRNPASVHIHTTLIHVTHTWMSHWSFVFCNLGIM